MDRWEFIVSGRYLEAIKGYTALLRRGKRSPIYCNRGIA